MLSTIAFVLVWPYGWLIAAAVVGLLVLYVLLRNPFWAYVAFIFSLPFATLRLVPIRGISNPAFMAILVLAFSLILNLHRLPPFRLGKLGVKPWLFGIFVSLALVTSPFTINQPNAIRFTLIAIIILLLYLVGTMLIEDGRKLRMCANFFLLAASISAFAVLYDFFFIHHPLNAGLYRAGSIYAGGPATGTVISFLIALPLSLFLSEDRMNWRLRHWYYAVAFFSVAAIILSATRSAWLALAVLALIGLIRRPVKTLIALALTAVLVIGAVRVYLPSTYAQYAARIFIVFNPEYGPQAQVGFRIENYRVGTNMLASYPLFGVGLANFGAHAGRFGRATVPAEFNLNAHNAFLEVLTTAGFLGGLPYILVWLLTLYELLLAAGRGPPRLRAIAGGLALGLIMYFTHSLFHSAHLALLLAFVFSMASVMRRETLQLRAARGNN
jgi:O-antigen ligase